MSSFPWTTYRSYIEKFKYWWKKYIAGRKGITNMVRLCRLQLAGVYRRYSSVSSLFYLHKSQKGKETGALLCSLSPACLWVCFIRNHLCRLSPWEAESFNQLGGNCAQHRCKHRGAFGSFNVGFILSDVYFKTKLQLRPFWSCCLPSSTDLCMLVDNGVHAGEKSPFIVHISLSSSFIWQ